MQKDNEGILNQIVRLDKNVKIKNVCFTYFCDSEEAERIDFSKCVTNEITDYRRLKEGIENIDITAYSKKYAYQPIAVRVKRK